MKIAIIPARANSRRIKNKNIIEFLVKNLSFTAYQQQYVLKF